MGMMVLNAGLKLMNSMHTLVLLLSGWESTECSAVEMVSSVVLCWQ